MLASLFDLLGIRLRGTDVPVPIGETRGRGPMPTGPVPGSKLTPEFVQAVGRFACLWAWPLVNVYNRYWTQDWVKIRTYLVGGVAPVAPINRLGMLVGYNQPGQRYITCPSQDLIYGFGVLDLSRDAVVLQVPDFGRASSCSRQPTSAPTHSAQSARCMEASPASICSPGRIGRAGRRRGSRPPSAPRPSSAASSPESFKPTTPPIIRRCSR
jgi:hypothetical protein